MIRHDAVTLTTFWRHADTQTLLSET